MSIKQFALIVSFVAASIIPFAGGSRAASVPRPERSALLPPILRIADVRIRTDDPVSTRKFFTELLGYDAAFSTNEPAAGGQVEYYKINDHQYVEVEPDLKSQTEDRLVWLGFETTDARRLRDYLAGRGVEVPAKVETGPDGSLSFTVKDPNGRLIQFIQYSPGSLERKSFGKDLGKSRISDSIIHAGFMVKDRAAEDKFYKDILGFRMIWYGGRKEGVTDYVDMAVPNGRNWIEYMLNAHDPNPKHLASLDHFSLGVPRVQAAIDILEKRDPALKLKRNIGRNGKPQTNVYAPSLTRVELMGPKPVRKPCCSPLLW